MEKNFFDFVQQNSPHGGFLQSVYWRKFQESVGRKTFELEEKENGNAFIYAYAIAHSLPLVGNYFYVPRGPVTHNAKRITQNAERKIKIFLDNLISLSKENNVGWIRVEPNSAEGLEMIKESLSKEKKMKKSPVNMQPREILVLDISKSEEEILAGMKQKTRYNIRLSQKKGVRITHNVERIAQENIEEFLRLVKITSQRDKITAHPENYYRKMFETIPPEILKLYAAEYEGKIIAANLVLFFGKTATYMHGASDNAHRDAMAPYLLQWQTIIDAKKNGCIKYDLGGVNTKYQIPNTKYKNWAGITKFKTGFAPETRTIEFPGCYDIILNPTKYWIYKTLRRIKP
ncbi:MAG: peptidoglycan bridge formation glycyltransferase FemA/FemB family protein [Candidatus Moranbacteria bacterium]|nr:peptidoglycan bridge formation glycyltransferase FemA/FemB family protein [Candidatus Moranbacteria bacterium]